MTATVPTQSDFAALEARVAALESSQPQPPSPPTTLAPATGGDDTAMINAALQAATSGAVYAPGGNVWRHDGMIEIPNNVTLQGDGDTSEFRSTNQNTDGWPQHAIHLTGAKPALKRVKVTTDWRGDRQGTPTAQAVWVDQATDWTVDHVHVQGSAAGGIFVERSSYGTVTNCLVENTKADGIGIGYSGSSYNAATDNTVDNAGDDGISVVSYTDAPQSTGNVIKGNTVSNGTYARGIVDVGGLGTVIQDNVVENMPACGILTIEDTNWNTYASTDAIVQGNHVSNCAQPGSGYSANYQFDIGTRNAAVINNVSTNPGGEHYAVHVTATITSGGNQPNAIKQGISGPTEGKRRK